jgi:xanthine dehydrogenase accessory factor
MTVKQLYSQLIDVLNSGTSAAVVSVYQEDGQISKSVASAADAEAWANVEHLLAHPSAQIDGPVASIAVDETFTVIERYTAKPRLIILGGGHIALALVKIAKLIDFEILVYDDRPSFANSQRFPDADTVICDGFDKLFERVQIKKSDYVVIVTRGHKHDASCLEGILLGSEPAYTGMIGSKRRVGIVLEQLRQAGYDNQRISNIHSPIGLRIGGVTPAEIAIAIAAELIAIRRADTAAEDLKSCDIEIAEQLAQYGSEAEALITIFQTMGSVPIDTGAKLSMTYAGAIRGTIGGGCSEAEAMQVAREVIRSGGWRRHLIDMKDTAEQDGMVCGGEMYVVIEEV